MAKAKRNKKFYKVRSCVRDYFSLDSAIHRIAIEVMAYFELLKACARKYFGDKIGVLRNERQR